MSRPRGDSRLSLGRSTLAVWILLAAGLWLAPPAAGAGPLDGVTGPVGEIAAPVQQALEQVATPSTAPPPPAAPRPASPPPAVEPPEVAVPDVPVKLPTLRLPKLPVSTAGDSPATVPKVAATAADTVAAASRTATGAGEAVSATGGEAAAATRSAAAEAAAAASTVGSATATAEAAPSTPPTAAGTTTPEPRSAPAGAAASRSTADNGPAPQLGAEATAPPPQGANKVLPGIPARLLHPFIHVWPAIALLTEAPLASFVRDWSRSALASFAADAAAPSGGEAPPLVAANPPPAAHLTGQPPFAPLAGPALTPFDWVAGEGALLGLALFLVLGASTLAILALGRRELGLPMFRRGNRFPWRH
ncbi:MAG: hypothetical protein AB7V58_12240 [Solirubrobacterales bacterium]